MDRVSSQQSAPKATSLYPWWLWVVLAAPILGFGVWWVWNESSVLPLGDGQYWCSETSELFGYRPGSDFAADVRSSKIVAVRPFNVEATETGYEVAYGEKVPIPSEIEQKGRLKFEASIKGYHVTCKFEDEL